jgi:dihydrofolate reductase
MILSIIAALDRSGVIGNRNRLPWRLPADLAHFKKTTWGKTLIVGRKTYESIGGPLPGRQIIVLTRNPEYRMETVETGGNGPTDEQKPLIVRTLEEALTLADSEETFVAGGAEIYRLALPKADRLYLTRIDGSFPGDAYFPEVDFDRWLLLKRTPHPADDRHSHPFDFELYERVRGL